MGRCGRSARSNASLFPSFAAAISRVSLSSMNVQHKDTKNTKKTKDLSSLSAAAALGRDERRRGALEEEDREAGVDHSAPLAVLPLLLDQHLRALGGPPVVSHGLSAVEHPGALERIEVVVILVLGIVLAVPVLVRARVVGHGEVLGEPRDALEDVLVLPPGALPLS